MMTVDDDLPEYAAGGDVPADLWGAAPLRGRAITVIEKALGSGGISVLAHGVADALIEAGLLVDETNREDRLIRRLRALRSEGNKIAWTIGEEIRKLRGVSGGTPGQ